MGGVTSLQHPRAKLAPGGCPVALRTGVGPRVRWHNLCVLHLPPSSSGKLGHPQGFPSSVPTSICRCLSVQGCPSSPTAQQELGPSRRACLRVALTPYKFRLQEPPRFSQHRLQGNPAQLWWGRGRVTAVNTPSASVFHSRGLTPGEPSPPPSSPLQPPVLSPWSAGSLSGSEMVLGREVHPVVPKMQILPAEMCTWRAGPSDTQALLCF